MTATDILDKVRLGMIRTEVVAALGEPTDVSATKRKRLPGVYKYGDIELHFTTDNRYGTLWLVYSEDAAGEPTTHAKC